MAILVTGGAGFIGKKLVSQLSPHEKVFVLDNLNQQVHGPTLPEYNPFGGNPNVAFHRGDIRDSELVSKLLGLVDTVVHLAAETGTGQSMYNIAHYCDVNQQATAGIFDLIAKDHRHIRKVILASSRAVYGEGAYLRNGKVVNPDVRKRNDLEAGNFELTDEVGAKLQYVATPEKLELRPASIYAATKFNNELVGQIFSKAFGISVTSLRFQNVYGPGQSIKNPYTGLISIFSNQMRTHSDVNIFEDGKAIRDFVHVDDVALGIVLALSSIESGYSFYNIGSGEASTIFDVAEVLKENLDSKSQLIISGDFRLGDIRNNVADLHKVKSELGFQPSVKLVDGLKSFTDWVISVPVEDDHSNKAMQELNEFGLTNG